MQQPFENSDELLRTLLRAIKAKQKPLVRSKLVREVDKNAK